MVEDKKVEFTLPEPIKEFVFDLHQVYFASLRAESSIDATLCSLPTFHSPLPCVRSPGPYRHRVKLYVSWMYSNYMKFALKS